MAKKSKYTFNDVVNECDKRNYKLISTKEDYKNTASKIHYICPHHIDKGILTTTLGRLLEGKGCVFCGRIRTGLKKRKIFNKKADKILCESKNFEYVDTYRNENDGKIYIYFICNKHRDLGMQSMSITNMKRAIKGCKYCKGDYPSWYILKKLKNEFPHITLLEPYINQTTRIKYRCEKHNYESTSTVQTILQGSSCYYCGIEKLSSQSFLSNEDVQHRASIRNPHVLLVDYKGHTKPSDWFCLKHQKKFSRWFSNLEEHDSGCDECYKEHMLNLFGVTHDEFVERLSKIHPSLEVQGKYVNNSTPILVYCTEHDCHYESTPANLYSKLACCVRSRVTYKEQSVHELLLRWGYVVDYQKSFEDCKDVRKLYFDFYLPDFNILIEYDGEQHFRPVSFHGQDDEDAEKKLNYTQKHDNIKNNYCKKNNIPLIRIPYWEYKNLESYLFEQLVQCGAMEETKLKTS